jgi:hypothetical protein
MEMRFEDNQARVSMQNDGTNLRPMRRPALEMRRNICSFSRDAKPPIHKQ